ncbi:MAG: class I SAM-dependent methyltransferase [Chloroflexota bacterium]
MSSPINVPKRPASNLPPSPVVASRAERSEVEGAATGDPLKGAGGPGVGAALPSPVGASSTGEGPGVGAAYDALAAAYDSQLAPAQWIRDRLWERFDLLFPSGSRVLDVTAGTGLDAIHLAQRGVRVTACDISPNMLAELHSKNPSIETRLANFNTLEFEVWNLEFGVRGLGFDGIISTFAGLNTSPDLRPFAASAAQLLRPGGLLFIHVLNRWPLLDMARQLARGRWRELRQTLASPQRRIKLGETAVPHYLFSPLALYRDAFAAHFRWSRLSGQGFVRPVNAKWGASLDPLDKLLGARFPFNSLGSFFSLELVRR